MMRMAQGPADKRFVRNDSGVIHHIEHRNRDCTGQVAAPCGSAALMENGGAGLCVIDREIAYRRGTKHTCPGSKSKLG